MIKSLQSNIQKFVKHHKSESIVSIIIFHIILVTILLLLFKSLFIFLVSIITLLIIGWLGGQKTATLSSIVVIAANAIIRICIVGIPNLEKDTPQFLFASCIIILLGIMTGRMSDVSQQAKKHFREKLQALSEKAKVEDQLRQAQKLEAVAQLAGGIAHDFNNMLGVISGYAELIRHNFSKENKKLDSYAVGIYNASKRATSLTANLLAFARKGKLDAQVVDMHEIIQNVCDMVGKSIENKAEITTDFKAQKSIVMGDNTQLQNIILNLAINAQDAMPQGGRLMLTTNTSIIDSVFTSTRPFKILTGEYLHISVIDTGTGMDDATKEKAFEPFFTTKEKGKGTGLGLASVYGSVKAHGGFVEIQSALGRGTTVEVWLPCAEKEADPVMETITNTKCRSGTVLVIDDEEYVRNMTSEMLLSLGYKVSTCHDGHHAVEYYQKHHASIDVVILDLIMPIMGGQDCFNQLIAINPAIKTIISTGFARNGEVEKVLSAGAIDCIRKPFSQNILADAMEKAMNAK